MSIFDYIKFNKLWIISNVATLIIINCTIFSSTYINKSFTDIIYLNILAIFLQLLIMFIGFRKYKKKYNIIIKSSESKECLKELTAYEGDFYIDLILKVLEKQNKKFFDIEENLKKGINELQDYITQLVHDIKVNIAVCDLVLEEIDLPSISNLRNQIEQIKFKINQILYVTRANHYNQDFIVEEFDISNVVKCAIRDNALFFINKNIEINAKIKPFTLISDKKWIHYIISQILNNSSKYTTNGGNVNIFSKEDTQAYYIHIKDNGIGIPQEDIKRIFDKGFTGNNGRNSTKSTGMGLYYAQKIANKLSIRIDVESVKGTYTEFILCFYKLSDYYKITTMSH